MAKKDFDLAASVSQAMGKSDVSNLDTMRIEYIDYDLIDSNEKNFYELSDLQPLANSIALDGLQQPLVAMTSPADPSRVLLVSGHRRHAAIGMLIRDEDSPRPDLRQVPFLRRKYQDSDLMELQLILANSTSRVLTSAETMRQAERVEALLYQLKEKGHDFPGKMRAQVAQACQISESKAQRLKTIRTGLHETFMKTFESGKLSEQAAVAIAKMPQQMQEDLATRRKGGFLNANVAEKMLAVNQNYSIPVKKCSHGKACTNGLQFLTHDAQSSAIWDMCKGEACCKSCHRNNSCKFLCPSAKVQAQERSRRANAESDKRKKKQEEEQALKFEKVKAYCERFSSAMKSANLEGKDIGDLMSTYALGRIMSLPSKTSTEMPFLSEFYPRTDTFAELCTRFGCSADWLLGLSDSSVAAAPAAGEWISHYAGPPPEGALVAVRRYNGGFGIFRYSGIGYCNPDDPEMTPLNVQCKSYCVLPE